MSGILPGQILKHVIEPTLNYLHESTGLAINSRPAAILLIGTAAHESHSGHWLSQPPTGPARGIYQMEVETHDWLWSDYLQRRTDIAQAIRAMVPEGGCKAERMTYDLAYATAMARVRYWVIPERLPEADDLLGMARYWAKYYNTEEGAGTVEKFVKDFRLRAGDVI